MAVRSWQRPQFTATKSSRRPCDTAGKPARLRARGNVASVAGEHFARAHLQPVEMARRDAPAIHVEHADAERHARGNLDLHGSVRLDRRVAEDLAHAEAAGGAERRAAEVTDFVVREPDRLFDADEPGGALVGRRLYRVDERGIAARRDVGAVEVVDAADVQDADVLRGEDGVVVDARDRVDDHGRQRHARRQRDHLGVADALDRLEHGPLRQVARVVKPHTI